MNEAIRLSFETMRNNTGGPFGAVVVKNGEIIARDFNRVVSTNDPTAHAEVVAIREACKALNTFQLDDCEIYTSCEPCPMCMAAIYWARPSKVYYANSKTDAAGIGFDDDFIYKELELSYDKRRIPLVRMMEKEALEAFKEWAAKSDKTEY
ncbi:MAG: nucleoside deaminase [Bacteroidetes bacterium]|nr:nucleoside deaminase [Bacteroidota bacterium]